MKNPFSSHLRSLASTYWLRDTAWLLSVEDLPPDALDELVIDSRPPKTASRVIDMLEGGEG